MRNFETIYKALIRSGVDGAAQVPAERIAGGEALFLARRGVESPARVVLDQRRRHWPFVVADAEGDAVGTVVLDDRAGPSGFDELLQGVSVGHRVAGRIEVLAVGAEDGAERGSIARHPCLRCRTQ